MPIEGLPQKGSPQTTFGTSSLLPQYDMQVTGQSVFQA